MAIQGAPVLACRFGSARAAALTSHLGERGARMFEWEQDVAEAQSRQRRLAGGAGAAVRDQPHDDLALGQDGAVGQGPFGRSARTVAAAAGGLPPGTPSRQSSTCASRSFRNCRRSRCPTTIPLSGAGQDFQVRQHDSHVDCRARDGRKTGAELVGTLPSRPLKGMAPEETARRPTAPGSSGSRPPKPLSSSRDRRRPLAMDPRRGRTGRHRHLHRRLGKDA